MLKLTSHKSNKFSDFQVFSELHIEADKVIVDFEVIKKNLKVDERFSTDHWDNWGLWENDVVEVFLTRAKDHLPYLELQLSPLGQKFALLIKKPRKETEKITEIAVKTNVSRTQNGFNGSFQIPKESIPGDSTELWGNLHACLYDEHKCNFYALKPNTDQRADFHRPEYFQKLGTL
ncbi:MAG: hypothetical protein CME62_04775 [Halobacteriovoraceae bacterium]|nr:hypothetical protein [Halobacteriovoraceae bacterium]|tara:strand:+ start:4444 stop:4971 length:528 start_codon:yes stop_codon:yes gene_type:complete